MRFIPRQADEWIQRLLKAREARYLIVGGANTAFGYVITVGLYYALSQHLHLVVISLIANAISITFSFTTYKLFVFKTRGRWLQEYLRSYVVYGLAALLGTALLWLFVTVAKIPVWFAQGIVILSVVAISYVGHSLFTFRRNH